MELIEFRVSMYNGIIDSGWVEVKPLTVLVGKNESGKTSVLKALHKLNPYNPEPYEMTKEWPRARRRERDGGHVVCQAKFHLSDQEKSELAQIAERELFPNTVEVSRNYAGLLEVSFEEDIFSDKLHPNDVDNACDTLPEVQDAFGDPFKQCVDECLNEARRFAHEGRFSELIGLAQRHEPLLREVLSSSNPPQQIENILSIITLQVSVSLPRHLGNYPLFNQKYMSTLSIICLHLSTWTIIGYLRELPILMKLRGEKIKSV